MELVSYLVRGLGHDYGLFNLHTG